MSKLITIFNNAKYGIKKDVVPFDANIQDIRRRNVLYQVIISENNKFEGL